MDTKNYKDKRDFSKTEEPKGVANKNGSDNPIFVIQKHDATNLHYDFRLEIGGTLKPWSVPQDPGTDPSVKRMAIPTEDQYGEERLWCGTKGILKILKRMMTGNSFPWKKATKWVP